MATQYAEVEVWVVVDQDGDYECAPSQSDAEERFTDNVSEQPEGKRLVKLTVKVPLPTVIELAGEVTADESGAGLTVRS
jgi:hypothetical protein